MIKFYVILLGCIVFIGCKGDSQKVVVAPQSNKKPNIIFLFADDQSYKDVHGLGNPEVITPTMDQLIADGTTFTHAYNMGGWNGAICVASRAMIISGRSIWRAQQISDKYRENKDLDKTWPRLMQTAGYETYMTGKWHVLAQADSIFDHVGHVLRGMPWDTPEGYNRPKSKQDTLWKPWKKEFGGYWKGGKHWSELVKDDAVSFIDSAAQKEAPFFMYIAFNAPHDPRQAPKKYVDMYPLDRIAVPQSHLPEYPYNEAMDSGRKLRDERLAPFPRTEYAVKVNRQEYYAITTHLDDQIKDILAALEKKGLKENTYIFYAADHGLSCGEHGLMGKQNMFDHSLRIPLMVVGPNIAKGKKVASDVYLQDVMATALDLGGVKKPDYIEFNSLLGQLKNNDQKSAYEGVYGAYKAGAQRMIRKDGFKLVLYPKSQTVLLFDLENDPLELHDLAAELQYTTKIKTLFSQLLKLQNGMGDQLDLKSIYPKLL